MKPNTQTLYELIVQGNDLFTQTSAVNTSVGLMDKALRNKGINADAVMVDEITSKNRLIFVLLDADTDTVGIGLGNIIEDNINLVDKKMLADITPAIIANLLNTHLL